MEFILAAAEHLPALCRITKDAKAQLKRMGLDQWQKGYPSEATWVSDMEKKTAWVAVENGEVLGAFMFQTAPEVSYAQIDGAWLSDKAPYGTIHRIATDGQLPGLGSWVIQWCLDLCGSIRIDTHEDNTLMCRTLDKLGFAYCGTIICDEGTPRCAYQKDL